MDHHLSSVQLCAPFVSLTFRCLFWELHHDSFRPLCQPAAPRRTSSIVAEGADRNKRSAKRAVGVIISCAYAFGELTIAGYPPR